MIIAAMPRTLKPPDSPAHDAATQAAETSDAINAAEASQIEAEILRQLHERNPTASICPSEVARALWPEEKTWRQGMPSVREVAVQLASAGKIQITQRGQVIKEKSLRGPVRLKLPTQKR
jgi:hypothetical protein